MPNQVASRDSNYPGIAPGANIIALKVFADQGSQSNFEADLEESLKWVINNAEAYNIAAVNLSLRYTKKSYSEVFNQSPSYGYAIHDELKTLSQNGVIIVSASGNDYDDAYQITGNSIQGVAYPSSDPYSLSVGAVWASPGNWGSYQQNAPVDAIAFFSQRDDELSDVFAPGGNIVSAQADGTYISLNGTSMASPQIAGMVLLAQQLAEKELGYRLTLAQIRDLIFRSGIDIKDGDDENAVVSTGFTFKRVDMHALAELILDMT